MNRPVKTGGTLRDQLLRSSRARDKKFRDAAIRDLTPPAFPVGMEYFYRLHEDFSGGRRVGMNGSEPASWADAVAFRDALRLYDLTREEMVGLVVLDRVQWAASRTEPSVSDAKADPAAPEPVSVRATKRRKK